MKTQTQLARALAARLKATREAKGSSVLDVAEAIGISHRALASMENGDYAPNWWQMYQLACHYSVGPGWLAFGDAEDPAS